MHDIKSVIPELFSEPGTLLYIGARIDAHSWLEELWKARHKITVLEIWSKNVKDLSNDWRIFNLIEGDVRKVKELIIGNFDYIFWRHGPEHLEQNDLLTILENLESKTQKLIALACPYGWYPQDAYKDNPYEKHLSTLYPKLFEMLGYQIKTDGEPDKPGSEIVAWKRLA